MSRKHIAAVQKLEVAAVSVLVLIEWPVFQKGILGTP
jgi:hypothetical protein